MRNGRSGWKIAGDLALRGGTLAVETVLFSVVWPGEPIDEDDDNTAGGTPRTTVSASRGDMTRVGE